MALILKAQVTKLREFSTLPSDYPEIYNFLLEAKLVPDLAKLISNSRKLLESRPVSVSIKIIIVASKHCCRILNKSLNLIHTICSS
jgi:hypothetical protein